MYSTLVFGPLYGWILCAVLMYAGVPQSGWSVGDAL